MVESPDNAFEAAKIAWTCYGWLLREVAAEVGWESALAIQQRVGRSMGTAFSGMLRSMSGTHTLKADCVFTALETVVKAMGFDYDMQISENSVTGQFRRCPIYSGLAASGMEHAEIQRACENFNGGERTGLQNAFPEITAKVKFRDRADDPCIEEFTLAR